MTVFMIKPTTAPSVENQAKTEVYQLAEKADPSTPADTQPEAETPGVETKKVVGEDGKETETEKMIKIDGPVGRVFTDALNKVLVQESYVTMLPAILSRKAALSREDDVEDDRELLQIYALDSDNLNLEDVVSITNDITKHTNREYIIAVEAIRGRVTKAMGFLDELGKMSNVSICYSQEKAINTVRSKLCR